jgi:hypothetical protein
VDDRSRRGLADALSRLEAWIVDGDYEHPTPFVEALDHLYRMEERERVRLKDHRYFEERQTHRFGSTVAGMMYARGLQTHVLDLVATVEGSRPFQVGRSYLGGGDTLRGPGVRLQWRDFADLPPPGKAERHTREVDYQSQVAGRDVVHTFNEAKQFFDHVAGLD